MSASPKVSIVIVSWNTCGLLQKCLESVYNHPADELAEVFVVDNASSDGSPQMVARDFPQAHLIASQENLGFAGGNNLAIPLCLGDYILLLNPDTEVQPGAVQALARLLDERAELGAVGARLLNSDGSLQESAYPRPTVARELWRLFHLDQLRPVAVYPMLSWGVDRPREVDVLKGAALMVRREVFDQAGLLDDGYFMYSEEVDLCARMRAAGWKLAWQPQAIIVHHEGRSTRQAAETMFLKLYEGKVRYFRKHHGPAAARTYKLVLTLAAAVRLGLVPLSWLEGPQRGRKHRALARRYSRLLAALPKF